MPFLLFNSVMYYTCNTVKIRSPEISMTLALTPDHNQDYVLKCVCIDVVLVLAEKASQFRSVTFVLFCFRGPARP